MEPSLLTFVVFGFMAVAVLAPAAVTSLVQWRDRKMPSGMVLRPSANLDARQL
jgi:hypothetical protein